MAAQPPARKRHGNSQKSPGGSAPRAQPSAVPAGACLPRSSAPRRHRPAPRGVQAASPPPLSADGQRGEPRGENNDETTTADLDRRADGWTADGRPGFCSEWGHRPSARRLPRTGRGGAARGRAEERVPWWAAVCSEASAALTKATGRRQGRAVVTGPRGRRLVDMKSCCGLQRWGWAGGTQTRVRWRRERPGSPWPGRSKVQPQGQAEGTGALR